MKKNLTISAKAQAIITVKELNKLTDKSYTGNIEFTYDDEVYTFAFIKNGNKVKIRYIGEDGYKGIEDDFMFAYKKQIKEEIIKEAEKKGIAPQVRQTKKKAYIEYFLYGQLLLPVLFTIVMAGFSSSLNQAYVYGTVVAGIVTVIYMYKKLARVIRTDHGYTPIDARWLKKLAICLVAFVVALVAGSMGSTLLVNIFADGAISTSQNQQSIIEMFKEAPLLMAIYSGIVGPIAEEFAFRTSFYGLFKNKKVAFVSTTALFVMMHFLTTIMDAAMGAFNPLDFCYLPSYLALSVVITYTYYKTQDVRLTSAMHIANNSLSVISTLMSIL